jgi:hypothetical protein
MLSPQQVGCSGKGLVGVNLKNIRKKEKKKKFRRS